MLDKEQAKEKLKNLVKDFKNNPDYYKKLSEADVEDKLVNELFVNILGWDKKDYEKRAKARRGDKGGSADYAFKINDRIVFFLEVKKVTIPLDKEADEQVILYSLSKKVPLAISTNFQQMNIFCVEQENAIQNVFRNFKTPDDYVNNFQDLLFLSKESFEQGLLLKKAEDEGRLKRRVSIDKVLLEDFWRVRTLIATDIEKNKSGKYNINEKDEIVQRILDRLIFIRRCEDIGINPENLTLEEIKHVAESRAYSQLKALFTKYDSVYNSGLFTPNKDNDCDIITIDGSIIKKLISYLYESHDKKYKYNFEWIDADVLGQVYEQYLGKILAQTKSGKAKLKEGQAHRKERGIYYTPTYIVDYIVKNTLGELLKDKQVDARKIKILDPACGSGSFLIKAFDYMQQHLSQNDEAKQHKLDFQGSYSVKTSILKDNIYGVDLDNKAVEITKLNLLLKAAEKFRKLPSELDNHIGWGNSLIDDNAFEHPFKWVGDFQEGTFDVVIGNPPYFLMQPQNTEEKILNYLKKRYSVAQYKIDTYHLFFEKSILLLKNEGYFGFITPNTFLMNIYLSNLRKFILDNCKIVKVIIIPEEVFPDASVDTAITILQRENNEKKRRNNKVEVYEIKDFFQNPKKLTTTSQNDFFEAENYTFNINLSKDGGGLIKKITTNTENLGELCRVSFGLQTLDKKTYVKDKAVNKNWKPCIDGGDISKYDLKFHSQYFLHDLKIKAGGCWDDTTHNVPEKIVIRQIGVTPIATLDTNRFYCLNTIYNITSLNENYNYRYILAILNSKLVQFYWKNKFSDSKILFPKIKKAYLDVLPIKKINLSQQQPIIKLVDHMLSLNKQLQEMGDKKTAQTAKLEEEIKKTDKEINDLVYKLYNITEEEKKIIEESVIK